MENRLDKLTAEKATVYRPRRHWIRNSVITLAVLTSAAVWGDAYNINSKKFHERSLESIFYSGTPAAEGTPADYFNYKPKIEVDEDGCAHLYFGNIRTGKFMPVHEDGRVGTFADRKKYLFERLGQEARETIDEIKQSEPYQKTSSTLKRWYASVKDFFTKG
jgi:hypothetical protein